MPGPALPAYDADADAPAPQPLPTVSEDEVREGDRETDPLQTQPQGTPWGQAWRGATHDIVLEERFVDAAQESVQESKSGRSARRKPPTLSIDPEPDGTISVADVQPPTRRMRVKRLTLSLWKVHLQQDQRRKVQLIRDFFINYVPYFVLLLFVHSSSPSPSDFLKQNQALEDILFDEEFGDVSNHKKTFHDVMTREELWSWSRGPLMGALFNPAPTGVCLAADGTTEDPLPRFNGTAELCEQTQPILGSNVLLGKVQFRQIRAAESQDCGRDPILFDWNSTDADDDVGPQWLFPGAEWRKDRGYKCYKHVHDDTAGERGEENGTPFAETGDFGPGVGEGGAGPIYKSTVSYTGDAAERKLSKIKGSVKNVEALWGGTRDYGARSYEVQLPRTSAAAERKITEMEQYFVGDATRVLAISMNIYNLNMNQYSIIQLVFELNDSGHIEKTIRVTTTKLL